MIDLCGYCDNIAQGSCMDNFKTGKHKWKNRGNVIEVYTVKFPTWLKDANTLHGFNVEPIQHPVN